MRKNEKNKNYNFKWNLKNKNFNFNSNKKDNFKLFFILNYFLKKYLKNFKKFKK